MPTITHALLSKAPASPPTEFRLFSRGVNHTTKGDFIFDDAAAASVMAAYKREAVDLPVDLEHESLGVATRPDSADARGWFKLTLRNGELWATSVSWTPDGARRLNERTQRYISPAFTVDKDGRVSKVLNAALVAMPATHGAPALAASKFGRSASTMLGARVTRERAAAFRILAAQGNTTPGELLRSLVTLAVSALTTEGADPAKVFAQLADLLEQPADAAPADLIAMLQELAAGFDKGPDQTADPLAGAADPAPKPDAFQLSANQARLMLPMTAAQRTAFIALTRRNWAARNLKKANR